MTADRRLTAAADRTGEDRFLAGAGEMGELVRSIAWETTPLESLSRWPQSLRTTMSICLNSRFPIAIYWGPEYLMLYNQSLVPMVGPRKHPGALGQPARVVLAEIWQIIEPLLRHVRTTGEATWSEDLMLPMARTGMPEESYFTFTYGPIRDETGGIGGVFCAVMETTDKVIEERRLRLLNALAEATRAPGPAEACVSVAAEIARSQADIPFALIYLLDDEGEATLAGLANIVETDSLAPRTIRAGSATPWDFAGLVDEPRCAALSSVGPGGAWGAVLLPLERTGAGQPMGFVVAGLSPMLAQSPSYTRFHKLLAASISQAVSSAAQREEERKRAQALAELDRAKTAFFSNISHEFRTPLALLLGPAEDALAAADSISAVELERWRLVHRNALRLSKLVNTLLDFSRIEAGRIQVSYEPTDLSAFTGELVSLFRSAIDRAALKLRVDLTPIEEPAYVDSEMWEKIVLNLLSNALKFTFEGEIAVSLRLVDADFELLVRDTGIGIAAVDMPHVFDRFHRIKGARARTHEGTGIGLALVAELVKLHGGHVGVASTVGRGTTFLVRLPRGRRHLPPDRVQTVKKPPAASGAPAVYLSEALRWDSGQAETTFAAAAEEVESQSPGGRRARIVLADDNADMREYLSRLLRERWDVEAVSNGAAALAALRGRPTDLVLADVMMPVMDGFELLRNIRGDTALRLMPVILLSARAGEEATSEGLNAGADDYIVKPFAARDLLVRVAAKLAVAGLANETRAVEEAARKRAEASERQFRELVENLPELSWTARPDGFIDYYNRRWFEYTGASVEQVQGWSWISLVEPGYVEPVMNRWRHSIATGEPFEMEFPLRGADGEFRWFMTRVRPLHDSAGRIIRWFGSNTNIDERRRHDDFRDTFLGILGHDLRNPLNTILMTSRLLEARAGTRQNHEIAQRVTRSGIRMQRMIEQLLDLTRARLTAGIPVTLSSEAVDVGKLVAGIVDEIRAARPQASIDMSIEGDCAARIDADRFEQVVSNLLDNAATHGEPGKPIRVEVVSKTNTVCLSVQNYGPPIDPAFLPLIFTPFARGETARRSSAGLGLGLYVSERIIAAHEGKLSVQSAPRTGTRFEAVIPRQLSGR
jgi:PAS domain S-box-containing protein